MLSQGMTPVMSVGLLACAAGLVLGGLALGLALGLRIRWAFWVRMGGFWHGGQHYEIRPRKVPW